MALFLRTTSIVLSGALLLAACGQKGPLVLPGYPKETAWPYPAKPDSQKQEESRRKAPDVPAASDSTK